MAQSRGRRVIGSDTVAIEMEALAEAIAPNAADAWRGPGRLTKGQNFVQALERVGATFHELQAARLWWAEHRKSMPTPADMVEQVVKARKASLDPDRSDGFIQRPVVTAYNDLYRLPTMGCLNHLKPGTRWIAASADHGQMAAFFRQGVAPEGVDWGVV